MQLNSSKHSLQDLSGLAREGRRGVCLGACVFRDRDQLWIPLTEVFSTSNEMKASLHAHLTQPLYDYLASCSPWAWDIISSLHCAY